MKRVIIIAILFLFGAEASAQISGLSGWNVYLDPGHSQNENMGVEGWSEAEHSLRVALHLRDILFTETDVDTVYVSRTNDQQSVTLSQRTTHANSVGADFFYSIHSDAGVASANSTLMLYGGWRQDCQTVEKTPEGGRLMGDILDVVLTNALRIARRGNYADRTFYQGTPCDHSYVDEDGITRYRYWPYLHVNRESVMASVLSEAGFHTNPTQNTRQMNTEFQRMQARATYWSFLDFHDIDRPADRIITGYVSDVETGRTINGATITVGDRTYTTDTFESLFHRFTNDPNRLSNGFYYMEEMPEGSIEVTFAAPGYASIDTTITMKAGEFTFVDAALISEIPPTVASTIPEEGASAHRFGDPIVINFSRPMDRASTEAAFSIDPETEGTFSWSSDNFRLMFSPADTFHTLTDYTVRIADSAEGQAGDAFDGDGNGEAGGEFVLTFRTGTRDVTPPVVQAFYPSANATGVERRPVVSMTYDEPLDPASVTPERFRLERTSDGQELPATLNYYTVREHGVVNLFPVDELERETQYSLVVSPGVSDVYGNETTGGGQVRFTTSDDVLEIALIDDFETNVAANWWHPSQSGSTTGIVADSTLRIVETNIVNPMTGSTQSLGIKYGWDGDQASTLIRTHLGGGTPRQTLFDDSYRMQAYVFGDGSVNQLRFAVRASNTGIGVSPWTTIDWYGWRLVTWDIGAEGMTAFHLDTQPAPYFMESLQLRRGAGDAAQFGTVYFDDLLVALVQDPTSAPVADVPREFNLHQNYPNPFNPSTTIPFDVAQPGPVTIRLYNALGAEVAVLVDAANLNAGRHEVTWDASQMPSGVYFARMEAGSRVHTMKLVLLK